MNQFNPHPDDDLLALLLADEQEQTQGLRARANPGANQSPAAVSFAQQRLWLLQQFNPDSAAYNLPRALSISGELDADLLQRALQQVVERTTSCAPFSARSTAPRARSSTRTHTCCSNA